MQASPQCEFEALLADGPPGSGAVRILARELRRIGFVVVADRLSGAPNGDAHALAEHPDGRAQLSLEILTALATASEWLALPDA